MAAVMLLPLAGVAGAQGLLADPRDAAGIFVEATASGDAAAIAALYAPDAILLIPNTPVVSGRDAIKAVHQRNAALGESTIQFTNVRINRGSDHAVVLWTWVSEIRPKSGAVIRMEGRSLVYFKRTTDGWVISADMMQEARGRP